MDKQQLLKALNLDESANADRLKQAYEAKLAEIDSKLEQAPTDVLKQKFAQIKTDLQAAYSAAASSSAVATPLSQTQMADLPQADASYTQFGEGGQAIQLAIREGDTLAGRYDIKEQIGVGGMGAVFRAFDSNRQEEIAIKVLLPHLVKSDTARERFLNEARLSSNLSHPNIVNVFDVQFDGDYAFITMELLKGQNLRTYLDNLIAVRQEMEVDDAIEMVSSLCDALSYAHETTVHRDIKPENIWITEDGKVKLMDFGIARVMSASHATKTGTAMGTAYYMAPEQLKGLGNIDGRADQYALGVLLYEMLAGEVPAGRALPLNEMRKDVPKAISDAVDKVMSAKPDMRFNTVDYFKNSLDRKSQKKLSRTKSTNREWMRFKNIMFFSIVVLLVLGGGGYYQYSVNEKVKKEHFSLVNEIKQKLEKIETLYEIVRSKDASNVSDYLDAKFNKLHLNVWKSEVKNSSEYKLAVDFVNNGGSKSQDFSSSLKDAVKINDQLANKLENINQLKDQAWLIIAKPKTSYVGGGKFNMGCVGEPGCRDSELPIRKVNIPTFLLGKYEVTKEQYAAFVRATGYLSDSENASLHNIGCLSIDYSGKRPNETYLMDRTWKTPSDNSSDDWDHPVTCVSLNDITSYLDWLTNASGNKYRLPSEAEWEYAAKEKKSSYRYKGDVCDYANGGDQSMYKGWSRKQKKSCNDGYYFTSPVGSFSENQIGIYDMLGNASEFVGDCAHWDYKSAPKDESVWLDGKGKWREGQCEQKELLHRGGSFMDSPERINTTFRSFDWFGGLRHRSSEWGFRVVKEIED